MEFLKRTLNDNCLKNAREIVTEIVTKSVYEIGTKTVPEIDLKSIPKLFLQSVPSFCLGPSAKAKDKSQKQTRNSLLATLRRPKFFTASPQLPKTAQLWAI